MQVEDNTAEILKGERTERKKVITGYLEDSRSTRDKRKQR